MKHKMGTGGDLISEWVVVKCHAIDRYIYSAIVFKAKLHLIGVVCCRCEHSRFSAQSLITGRDRLLQCAFSSRLKSFSFSSPTPPIVRVS